MSARQSSLAELIRHLVLHPSDEDSLSAVRAALHNEGQVEELTMQLEMCFEGGVSDHDLAELAFRIAAGCDAPQARELCRTALDFCSVHWPALSLLEQLADAFSTDDLCARLQIFLQDAPSRGVAREICENVTSKLITAQCLASTMYAELEEVDLYQECELSLSESLLSEAFFVHA